MTNTIYKTVCAVNACTGCNSCVCICQKNAISIVDELVSLNAVIDTKKCVNCGACSRVCQNIISTDFTKPIAFFQGWNNNFKLRLNSSSGGFIVSVVYRFLEENIPVYSCVFQNGAFSFRRVEDKNDFTAFSGSKYVKSNTGVIYKAILKHLKSGRKVLFIGLPCQVQGLKLFVGKTYWNNLYTIDLICHGSPSARLYDLYLKECGYDTTTINYISFRCKNKYSKNKTDKYQYWLSPFLDGLTYTENCYSCQYAKLERVSDLTAGDSWGSSLPIDELNKGVSLVLCNTEKGLELLERVDFHKENVDPLNAIENNAQLIHPMKTPEIRPFFKQRLKEFGYHKAISACYWKKIIRYSIGTTFIGKSVKTFVMKKKKEAKVDISFSEHIY